MKLKINTCIGKLSKKEFVKYILKCYPYSIYIDNGIVGLGTVAPSSTLIIKKYSLPENHFKLYLK